MEHPRYPVQGSYPPKELPSKDVFEDIRIKAEEIGSKVEKKIDTACSKITEAVDKDAYHILDKFKTDIVVQLVSRVTERAVQIVLNPDGEIVLDANGPPHKNTFNALWKVVVVDEEKYLVRFHNFDNYITIEGGKLFVKHYPFGAAHGPETTFRLSEVESYYVVLESLNEEHHYVEFMPSGEVKPARVSTVEQNAHFAVTFLPENQLEEASGFKEEESKLSRVCRTAMH